MRNYAFIFLIFVCIDSHAQTDMDYLYINKIINKQSRRNLPLLIKSDLIFNELYGESYNEDEITQQYAWSINELFADTLTQYAGVIDKQIIKDSFVKWNKRFIKHTFTEDVKNVFCYITKPILLDNRLFVVITFDECALGGITACLYQYDEVNRSIKSIKFNTIRLNGFDIEW